MSDSFADLWSSAAPSNNSKSNTASQKLGAALSVANSRSGTSTPTSYRPQNDLFAQLSSAGNSRSGTPSLGSTGLGIGMGSTHTNASAARPAPKSPASSSTTTGDAFSGLFGDNTSLGAKSTKNMTMAERAALAEKERKSQLLGRQQVLQAEKEKGSSAWDGLDQLGFGNGSNGSKVSSPQVADEDDWGFGLGVSGTKTTTGSGFVRSTAPSPPSKVPSAAASTMGVDDDDWGLGDFGAAPAPAPAPAPASTKTSASSRDKPAQSQSKSGAGSLWDLDEFTSNGNESAQARTTSRPDSPSRAFDFGNREDEGGNLLNGGGDEDDILGALGKPVESLRREREAQVQSTQTPPPRSTTNTPHTRTRTRTSSPPPHVLGQLVEMGFSITQARAALAATDSGEDVQAALEVLISNGAAGDGGTEGEGIERSERRGGRRDDGWGSDNDDDGRRGEVDEEWDGEMREGLTGGGGRRRGKTSPPQHQQQQQQQHRSSSPSQPQPRLRRDRQIAQEKERARQRERELSSSSSQQATNLQEQADKILAQASEIGFSLFNRANAAWKEGKEKVQKVYEERMAAGDGDERRNGRGGGTRQRLDGRPRWMVEQEFQDEHGDRNGAKKIERFEDIHGDDIRADGERRRRPVPEKTQSQEGQVDLFSSKSEQNVDLFSAPPPAPSSAATSSSAGTGVYVSRFRHGRPKPQSSTSTSTSAPPPAAPPKPHPTTLVTASPSSLSTSQKHKAAGTSAFKLGDFPAAEAAYTRAIEVLPEGHALLIPLYNNRALARLRTGNSSGAQEDAGVVEGLVGGVGGVREELRRGQNGKIVVSCNNEDEEVNLGDALVKAWKRRAEALEGREKWEEAGKDWERVAGAEWAGQAVRGEGARGAGRCRKMVNPTPKATPPAAAISKPKPKPATVPRRGPTPPSQALNTLRAANIAAESEDSEKYALKDTVDGKLQAWKGGKETNIRALLASLDTILWPELGVEKLSMAQLISEGQVKIKYMKAIAKVHPDKLNKGNSTVEQRMIAGGVFGALNEAWNAFKA